MVSRDPQAAYSLSDTLESVRRHLFKSVLTRQACPDIHMAIALLAARLAVLETRIERGN